ncbi:hypothetical protein B0J13DRAFT_289844 [Dactylonectria estremocensis]|uniref:Uncharacterized protein n=1 Tax=Dactylonectria estremocensis TaxID=1079267 RepID=A0A9P9F282_9HYPO|nr:hypothetical protein B0J13DRAFT_289844 [Dactylonectria estremocensis]
MDKDHDAERRSAAEYALAHQCFRDHRGPPFQFHDHIHDIQKTSQQVKSDGLVHQPGLIKKRLPLPVVDLELDAPEQILTRACSSPSNPPQSFIDPAAFRALSDLRLSPEPLDLGYDTKKDLQQYVEDINSKRFCNILNEWLPLCRVDVDKDEGLNFPSASDRWQKLALREIHRETLNVPEEAKKLVRHAEDTRSAWKTPWLSEDALGFLRKPRAYPDPVSPPLSPTSSLDEPFVPSPRVITIDLTSEPSSPPNSPVAKLQRDLHNGCLDSEPAAPPHSSRPSSPPDVLRCFGLLGSKSSNLRLDVPLVISSPFQLEDRNPFMDAMETNGLNTQDLELHPTDTNGSFDEAMEAIIDSCHERTIRNAEQERLNPTDSLLRVQVPSLNFDYPEPEWAGHLSSSGVQFNWMRKENPVAFELPLSSSIAQLGVSLKWTPIPPGTGRVSCVESLGPLEASSRQYLKLEIPGHHSSDYISDPEDWFILRIIDDEELEPDQSPINDTACAEAETVSPVDTLAVAAKQGSADAWWKTHVPIARQSLRNNTVDEAESLLPLSNDPSATSKLLSSFIQLRHPKKIKTSVPPPQKAKDRSQVAAKSLALTSLDQEVPREATPNLPKATAPTFCIPPGKFRFIVSMSLSRSVMSSIEKSWPHLELIDKDFSQYNEVKWSSSSAQCQEVISPLSFEADVVLSPSVGMILTTMLKVKQKPLPGSTLLAPLRNRIQRVSEKYESLFVFVSEANPHGEYVGTPSASDMTAYADFVRFTTSLQAGITTELVHGAEETLSKWVLALMARFATASLKFAHLISAHDTEWGLFLRRAGMNIVASQVLERMLEADFGDLGMIRFLDASLEEMVLKYGLVMGHRVLTNVCRQLRKG